MDYPCQPGKYRAYNGYCNNVQNPNWGVSNRRYLRYIQSDYADGISVPRQRPDGQGRSDALRDAARPPNRCAKLLTNMHLSFLPRHLMQLLKEKEHDTGQILYYDSLEF